jgi:hypothetical protein
MSEENFLESGAYSQPESDSSESSEAEESLEVSEEESSEESNEASSEESQELSEESQEGESESEGVQAETEAELEKEVEEAIEDGATAEEVTNMIREFQLKVNGKEYTRKIDLNDSEAVQKEMQMALAGRQAMQHLAESQRSHKNDIERLKSDTASVLKELDIDPVDFASRVIKEHLAQNEKSPEELAQEAKMKEHDELRAEVERLRKEKEDKERSDEMAKMEKEIETDILSVLEGDTDLPNTPEVIAMVADNMLWAMQNGWDDVTAKDVLPTVKRELQQKFRTIAGSLKSTSALKALLGDDILNNLRQERVEQVKQKVNTVNSIKQGAPKEEVKEKPSKKVSLKDFMGM